MSGGVYVVVFVLGRATTLRVGRLGAFRLSAGRYAYVGSAQRGLAARIARHGKRAKPLRWHVDYLSRRARLEAACAWPLAKAAECRLAAAVGRLRGAALAVPRFGASDCRCPGHLYRLAGPLDPAALLCAARTGRARARGAAKKVGSRAVGTETHRAEAHVAL